MANGSYRTVPAQSHSAIEYTLIFDDEWRTNETHTVKLGYELPHTAPVFPREHYTFLGWFDRKDGHGTKYYNADGSLVNPRFPWYSVVGDLTLHAAWEV